METIRNYLETMFYALPNTDQVRRAKDELYGMMEDIYESLGVMGMFLLIAVGVGIVLYVTGVKHIYRQLLALNDRNTVGGNLFASQKELHYREPMVEAVMSVYWQTVLCLYLLWSFLSFAWERTWVIWPLAVLIHWLIRKLFEGEPVNAKA